jgi:hypothetical protein
VQKVFDVNFPSKLPAVCTVLCWPQHVKTKRNLHWGTVLEDQGPRKDRSQSSGTYLCGDVGAGHGIHLERGLGSKNCMPVSSEPGETPDTWGGFDQME